MSNKLRAFFSGFGWFPVGRCTKGDAEDERSEEPENWEHCEELVSYCIKSAEMMRLTKPVLEHVHGKGGCFLWSGFLVPPRVGGELFTVMVRRRGSIVPRFAGATNVAGSRGGVRNSKEVIERINFTLLEGLMRDVGGGLWRWSGKVDRHTSAGDNGGRSCLTSSSGRDKIPRAGDSAGGGGRSLSRDGGGNESDGRHFADLERGVEERRT